MGEEIREEIRESNVVNGLTLLEVIARDFADSDSGENYKKVAEEFISEFKIWRENKELFDAVLAEEVHDFFLSERLCDEDENILYGLSSKSRESIENFFLDLPEKFVDKLYRKYEKKFSVREKELSNSDVHTAEFGRVTFSEINYLISENKNYESYEVCANWHVHTLQFDKNGNLERDCIEDFVKLFFGGYDAVEQLVKKEINDFIELNNEVDKDELESHLENGVLSYAKKWGINIYDIIDIDEFIITDNNVVLKKEA